MSPAEATIAKALGNCSFEDPSAPQFMVVCSQVVGGGERPFEIIHNCDHIRFSDRSAAIAHGFKIRGSDDFNIAVVRVNRLISFDWMEEPIGEDADGMREIAGNMGLLT